MWGPKSRLSCGPQDKNADVNIRTPATVGTAKDPKTAQQWFHRNDYKDLVEYGSGVTRRFRRRVHPGSGRPSAMPQSATVRSSHRWVCPRVG